MIKIISGYTNKGGSTTAFINLTNMLNSMGYDCTFYGPHDWHLDKCKSGHLNNIIYNPDDSVIAHYIGLPSRPPVKRVLFACHEKWWFDFSNVKMFWDEAIFLHEQHRQFHKNYVGPYSIIPNLKENLSPKNKPELDLVAGIIGSIEIRKQTHLSIQRAIKDRCKKIYLFGGIGDETYYNQFVKPYLSDRVEYMGFTTDKQNMYDMIGRVYHSSKGEVACLVKDECYLTNTEFFGNEETANEVSTLTNNEIIKLWVNKLKI
jgi:hypothetical protein